MTNKKIYPEFKSRFFLNNNKTTILNKHKIIPCRDWANITINTTKIDNKACFRKYTSGIMDIAKNWA